MQDFTIEYFWKLKNFNPNDNQREAILQTDGPLFLTAGPGSGKTRVILWRTVNLIVFHKVDPKDIFLATFTEKAAHQLKEGLRALLGVVTNYNKQPYDISAMSIGTVHSICQEILVDSSRRFSEGGVRGRAPILLDELSQYFKIYKRDFWIELLTVGGFHKAEASEKEQSEKEQTEAQEFITNHLSGIKRYSRNEAAKSMIKLFNRFSEENLDLNEVKSDDELIQRFLTMYRHYCESHKKSEKISTVDFSLLQQKAYNKIKSFAGSQDVYKYIIIDEYQDTNSIQEQIYFELAKKCKNICVVGDDDQALYRFRGATVENLVEFEERCLKYLGQKPKKIALNTNYRSKKEIVDFYVDFMTRANWRKANGDGFYRVMDKNIKPNNQETFSAVVATEKNKKEVVCAEVAQFIFDLKKSGKISDYNQVAILFPSMKKPFSDPNHPEEGIKSAKVFAFEQALNRLGIKVFAPRAGRFLEVPEAVEMLGLFFCILGRPSHQGAGSAGLRDFRLWQLNCINTAEDIIDEDSLLKEYIADRKNEIEGIKNDYEALMKVVNKNKWNVTKPLKLEMLQVLANASGLSQKCKSTLQKQSFTSILRKREQAKQPVALSYVLNRVTSLDWSVLDLFYQLSGFRHFQKMFALAEEGSDEGPVCNLGLLSQYLARFMEEYSAIITASFLWDDKFVNVFVGSYLYAIYRLGESEFEDSDDPFPRGRVPFLTIHQAKGLEFPYVVLGSLRKDERSPDPTEIIIRELLKKEGEPLDKIANFDKMRMFYVALSRAKQMTILPYFDRGKTNTSEEFLKILENENVKQLSSIDLNNLPGGSVEIDDLGKSYSYTADYLSYKQCPRKYMIFTKYGFIPSRSQTMFFGSLVHQTIEDLHHLLIAEKKKGALTA
jgi:DNA helicase-2/ATP-dependent DNA helicase PcrA